MVENEQIILGSGKLYITTVGSDGAIPVDTEIEVAENELGYISGGASLEYKPEELEVSDDSGAFVRRFVTKEEITFKSGILTWNAKTLSILAQGAASSYTDNSGVRKLTLGGRGAREMKQYVIHFVHEIDSNNKMKITLVGTASNGFSLAFAANDATVIDAEFKAISHDENGTQVIITETYTDTVA